MRLFCWKSSVFVALAAGLSTACGVYVLAYGKGWPRSRCFTEFFCIPQANRGEETKEP